MKRLFYLLLIMLCIPINIKALEYPKVNSKVVEIYDINDRKVLYELDSNSRVSIASLTKIATTITAIENISNLQEKVTITKEMLDTVRWDASKAGLEDGDTLTYKDLLYASMLPSGADATNSIAILSSGSIENFVDKMNKLSVKIGLDHTHFSNVTGLDDSKHYSTADDVRKLLSYALENQTFKEIYKTKEYTMSNGKDVRSTIFTYSKNPSIDVSPILGSKTGFTLDAGYCLSSLSNINGHEVIIIVLNAQNIGNIYYNINDTLDLIKFLNENFKDEVLVEKNSLVKKIPVSLSKIDSYNIYSNQEITKYLPSDYNKDNIRIEYEGLDEINFLNHKDDRIGKIKYYYEDELLVTQDIILTQDIKMDFIKVLQKYYVIVIVFVLLLIIIFILKHNRKRKKIA